MERPLNPFDPGRPISPGQFVGRHLEIEELEAALSHAKAGRPRHFLLTGERGVGKTSFLDYIRRKATDGSRGEGLNFLVVDFAINRNTTRLDFARALQSELASLLSAQAPLKDMLSTAWTFIQKIEAAGFSYRGSEAKPENHQDMYQAVADSLCVIVNKVCGTVKDDWGNSGCDGLLILIDEVDQASEELDIGAFLKYLLERLNRKNCHKVVFGLAGLRGSTEVLVKSHPSSLRIFDELSIGDLEWQDVEELFAEAELQVRNEGYDEFNFSEKAKALIFELSHGHPHFVHQLGYCAFEQACKLGVSSTVEETHVMSGAFETRGAIDLIGDVYFERPFQIVIDNENAVAILDCISESSGQRMSLIELQEQIRVQRVALVEAITLLKNQGLVVVDEKKDQYSLRHRCFGYWLKARLL